MRATSMTFTFNGNNNRTGYRVKCNDANVRHRHNDQQIVGNLRYLWLHKLLCRSAIQNMISIVDVAHGFSIYYERLSVHTHSVSTKVNQ